MRFPENPWIVIALALLAGFVLCAACDLLGLFGHPDILDTFR